MENLLVQSLYDYIRRESHGAFNGSDGAREVRLFLASFPAPVLARVFGMLSDDMITHFPGTRQVFKVAQPLWESWQGGNTKLEPALIKFFQDRDWVDLEDRLTFFRNAKAGENDKGLITILAGVDKVLDKGGLADFHQLGEETLWLRQMKKSYGMWVRRFLDAVHIDASDGLVDELDEMLQTIYSVTPRNLVHLAEYLSAAAKSPQGFANGSEVVAYIFATLPTWGLFPVAEPPKGLKKRKELIRSSAAIARRSPFIDKLGRNRARKRVDAFLANEEKQRIPAPMVEGTEVYTDFESFAQDLKTYIEISDAETKARLLQVDFTPIHELLNYREKTTEPKSPTELRVYGPALLAFQSALWHAAERVRSELKKKSEGMWLPELLKAIDIKVDRFQHDMGSGEEETALKLYEGLLGGIDTFLEADLKLRSSSHSDSRDVDVPVRFDGRLDTSLMKPVKSRDPYVEFTVTFVVEDEDGNFEQKCRWIVDPTHEERVLQSLARRALGSLDGKLLPAYRIPTYTELFFSADAEEASRLLEISEASLSVFDLADSLKSGLTAQPTLHSALVTTSQAYASALRAITKQGYFSAMGQPVLKLLQSLETLYKFVLDDVNVARGDLGCALYKAHMLLPKDVAPYESYVANAIAFGLTPAVLEQLQAREVFLARAFPPLFVRQLEGDANRGEFDDLKGMVELQRPLLALITNQHSRLSTQTRGLGHVHIFGERPLDVLSLASQAVMREDDIDDDDYSDGDLFRSSPESRIYASKLRDYYRTHPIAHDGMSVLALDVENIQTLVAGVHEFLGGVLQEEDRISGLLPPFQFSLHIYLMSASALSIQKWLEAWRRRWDPSKGRGEYPNCALSLAFRPAQNVEDYVRLLEENDSDYDVAFLVRFLQAHDAGDHLEPAEPFSLSETDAVMMKFPITEAPRPATKSEKDRYKRFTNLSNRRLRLPTLHAELSARLKGMQSNHHLVFASVDHKPWLELVDKLHAGGRCRWVVCMDPYIDRGLLGQRVDATVAGRELVGFSSGLGGLGELNVTVSTETTSVSNLTARVGRGLNAIFKQWAPEDTQRAAQSLVAEAQQLSGFSLIRAIDRGESIREVAAHALVRRAFPPQGHLCDVLLSIDSYQHWLSSRSRAEARYRPDLLRLQASIKGGLMDIDATVIECKLANESEDTRQHALEQVEAGLRILIKNFLPSGYGQENDAYVRRYWWAQLQRAIAAHSSIHSKDAAMVAAAIEKLGEGQFSITWHGVAMTFWADAASTEAVSKVNVVWDWDLLGLDIEDNGFGIYQAAFSAKDVAELAVGNPSPTVLPCQGLRFVSRRFESELVVEFTEVKTKPTEIVVPGEHAAPMAAQGEVKTPVAAVSSPLAVAVESTPAITDSDTSTSGGAPVEPQAIPPQPVAPLHVEPTPLPTHPVPVQQIKSVPDRILLGTAGGTRHVYWEFGHPELTNRHLLIFGRSGVGKTYAIQCLLAELAHAGQNSAVIDYTEGFLPMRLEPGLHSAANPTTHLVLQQPLPMNPVKPLESEIPGFGRFAEKPHETAGRIMSVFNAVYNLGEQQQAKLVEAVKAALQVHGDQAELRHVVEALEQGGEGAAGGSALTLANKIRPFIDVNAFGGGDGGWESIYQHPTSRLAIIQLAKLPREYARIITEFSLWDLYGYAQNFATDKTPLPIVLDEVQTLNHQLGSPVAKILTEGRKFGLAGIFATQTMSNLKAEEQDRLFQAAHKLFFAPAESEVKEYAKLLSGPTGESVADWVAKLSALRKGECWSFGPSLEANGHLKVRPQKIQITPFEHRTLGGVS